MNIAVIGAGQVGTHIATVLSRRGDNVVILDQNEDNVRRVEEALDVQTLVGHGTDVDTLYRAGVPDCDLVLAVTDSDEVNFLAALLAKRLGARKTFVRARKSFYLEDRLRRYVETCEVDQVVCPEVLTAQEIAKRIEHPGTRRIEYFAHGRIQMRTMDVDARAPQAGRRLREIPLPGGTLVVGISRDGKTIIPRGDDRVEAGDTITIIGSTANISRVEKLFGQRRDRVHRVVIAGGKLVGLYLAQILERRHFSVRLVERRRARCEELAHILRRTEVLHGDMTVLRFLEENRLDQAQAFAATTRKDHENLMACLLMRELGVTLTAVVIHRPDFASLVAKLDVSITLSPRFVVADTVLNMLQQKNVLSVAQLGAGDAEVIECRASASSPLVGKSLKEAKLPRGTLLGAIVRQGDVIVPKGDDHVMIDDSVVVFATREAAPKVKRLFRGES